MTRSCYYQGLKALRKSLGDSHLKRLQTTNESFSSLVDNIYSLPYVPQEDMIKVYKDVILPKFESLLKLEQTEKRQGQRCLGIMWNLRLLPRH